jgi:hypothetical protein
VLKPSPLVLVSLKARSLNPIFPGRKITLENCERMTKERKKRVGVRKKNTFSLDVRQCQKQIVLIIFYLIYDSANMQCFVLNLISPTPKLGSSDFFDEFKRSLNT